MDQFGGRTRGEGFGRSDEIVFIILLGFAGLVGFMFEKLFGWVVEYGIPIRTVECGK